jgi:hypothetical protein
MFLSLKKRMMGAITDYDQRPLMEWVLSHPAQVCTYLWNVIQTLYSEDMQYGILSEARVTCSVNDCDKVKNSF